MPIEKFREFLREIAEGDDWEYGDGTPMTQDAKEILVLLNNESIKKMNEEQWEIFKEIAQQCESGHFSSINVASKMRSDAIIAVYEQLYGRTTFLIDAISDGFGSTWSAYCPRCGEKTMQIVRPGQAECSECGV